MIQYFTIWDVELLNKIQTFKKNSIGITKVFFDGAIEYQYDYIAGQKKHMTDLIEFCKDRKIELNIITGTHPSNVLIENSEYCKIHYWYTFWLSMALHRLSVSPNYQINNSIGLDVINFSVGKNLPIKYSFISMNKAPKIHRAIMMDMLAKHNILDKGVVIWREWCNNYGFKHWQQEQLLRDQKDKFMYQEMLPIEYSISFAQLVPESDEQIFTLSEKTSMALYFNKPFLVAGCKGFHKILQNMGFALYDELFDYSFDEVEDITIRYDMIAQNFSRYANRSTNELKQIYASVFEKCVYNKKMAFKLATSKSNMPAIVDELSEYLLQNNIPSGIQSINNFIQTHENEY